MKSQFYPFCTESPVCHRVIILSHKVCENLHANKYYTCNYLIFNLFTY